MQTITMNYQDIATQLQTKSKVYAPTELADATHIKYSVFYDLGGMNYFNGERNRRGYYLSVTPVTKEDRDGYSTESFTLFKGTKYFISGQELKRNTTKARRDATANVTAELIEKLTVHISK